MIIDDVHRGITKNKKRKRIGRGPGSGHGKTAGRGHKGAGSRRGHSSRLGFAGGQMPLFRIVAKRGFNNNAFADKVLAINVSFLEERFESGDTVNLDSLKEKGLAKGKFDLIKILGDGDLTKKLTVQVHRCSKGAEEKIKSAGGSVELIG
ncbi:MAG: 50S ribosomal protein L15 [Planctomycetaceae bacterium]|nr:50S ribosomal protein L15 [Planctomycetaceae bacterium]MCB9953303.1 50S ribosomal protein L15 [Planctomycetaceae bacterium]